MNKFAEVKAAARGKWLQIFSALGVRTELLQDRHGPCPGCGGKDRFRYDDKDGDGTFICSQGGGGNLSGDGFTLLEHINDWDSSEALRAVAGQLGMAMNQPQEPVENQGVAAAPRAPKQQKRAPYDAAMLELFAQGVSEKVDRYWLAARSKVSVEWGVRPGLAADFLDMLYDPDDVVLIFTDFFSQGDFALSKHKTWRLGENKHIKAISSELPMESKNGVWFLTNPVSGKWEPFKKGDKWVLGRRHSTCITSWRYLVLESDDAPAKLWVKALIQLKLPIAAIYTSGGKSIHALVRVDAASKGEFDQARDRIVKVLCPLGADGGAVSGVRLSRLPGCYRGDRMQELLYLDPDPTWRRIIDLPELRHA